ncbi:PH domain-containing protein [Millisia brevis]|uniref:PH domain-containing protein n=1 Tax=Millisia brevis TaxID=264148 RepID=UPI001470D1AA|nr:PH domain-containing protein [Millisia brevis]
MLFFATPRKRWQAWFVTATVVAFGSALIVAGFASIPAGWSWNTVSIPVGVFFCTGGLVMYSWHLAKPQPVLVEMRPGQAIIPIWRTYLHGALTITAAMLLVAVWGLGTALLLESIWWPWLLAVAIALPGAVRVFRSIRDSPTLVLSPHGIRYRGPGINRYLDWSDIRSLEVDEGRFGRIIRVVGSPLAPSYQHAKRYRVPPYESTIPDRTMEVSAHGPREDDLIRVILPVLRECLRNPRVRTEIGTPAFQSRLDSAARLAEVDSADTNTNPHESQ